MGVDGLATTRPLAATPPQKTPAPESPLSIEELSRRRTSIPPSFTYGTGESDASADESERRWRSFDCAGSAASTAKAVDVLSSRIEQEQHKAAQHSARLRPRKRSALLRSFLSSSRKEQIELRQMEMVAQVAKCNRSLVVLRDVRTLVLTMDDDDDASSDAAAPRGSLSGSDAAIQRMLDGLADADAVLAEDSLHHILELQTQFLQKSVDMHGDKKLHVAKSLGVSPSLVLQQFLSEFLKADGAPRLPVAVDAPTPALVRFEKIVNRYKLIKPTLKRSLDALCRDTMSSFTRTSGDQQSKGAAAIWDEREPRDVLPSLVREIEESILETAWVSDRVRPVLRALIEQMVFSRLAGACYRSMSVELDEQNSLWREQIVKARQIPLEDVGLPVDVPEDIQGPLFAESIAAFNRLPHLVPSSVMAAFLGAVRVLYNEAATQLGLTCGCISADVLLPLLVFVLSRTDLPHLHSQVFLMEQFAIDESTEGSEAAYYLACLQAAMGYIMTEVGKKPASS